MRTETVANRRRCSPGILILVGLGGVAGCWGGGDPGPAPIVSGRRAEPVSQSDRLYSDDRSEVDRERVVIADVQSLRLWWDRATAAAGDPKPAMPDISFETHMVLLVSAGRSDAGDQIRVDSVGFEIKPNEAGGSSPVSFAVVRTTPDCNPFPGDSWPLEMVRMARADPPIDWIEITSQCPGTRDPVQ